MPRSQPGLRRSFRPLAVLGIAASVALTLPSGTHAAPRNPLLIPASLSAPSFGRPDHVSGRRSTRAPFRIQSISPGQPLPHADLTDLAPPVGNQGDNASCASWVMAEYRYSLAVAAGEHVAPFAPMYLYAQLAQGVSVGTTLQANLEIVETQGIEQAGDYSRGPAAALNDYTDQPTPDDRARAAPFRLSDASWIYWTSADEQSIESWMAATHLPLVFIVPIYSNFDDAGYTDAAGVAHPLLIGMPTSGMQYRGGHVVMGYRTDANGVWFMNSWGTGYGKDGWAELSWDFIRREAVVYALRVGIAQDQLQNSGIIQTGQQR